MNCRLVFFAARKTSFCERALQKSFSELDLELVKTCFATDSEQLGNELTDAFKKLNVVFVVGGLGFDDEKGIKSIISRALCETPVNDCKKLKNENGDDGYVVRAANQILILLPDEPEQIETIMQGPLRKYIMANSVMQ
jgi:molybdopterin-biosynthesis enzyme MoeA-like protein